MTSHEARESIRRLLAYRDHRSGQPLTEIFVPREALEVLTVGDPEPHRCTHQDALAKEVRQGLEWMSIAAKALAENQRLREVAEQREGVIEAISVLIDEYRAPAEADA